MSGFRRCGRPTAGQSSYNGCQYDRMPGKQQCVWHWLLKQPAAVQAAHAGLRLQDAIIGQGGADSFVNRARVPAAEWPDGERWCAGCQSFVPLFYVSGSRCKSCSSEAAHGARVEKVYGISKAEYEALFELQGGRCFICQRKSTSRRLAVDHDHDTGKVRGLLCPDPERGCNHAILGNIKDVAMARRILLYLARPPYERLTGSHEDYPFLTWDRFVRDEVRKADRKIIEDRQAAVRAAEQDSTGTRARPPF